MSTNLVLKVYLPDRSESSQSAVNALSKMCEQYLPGRYSIAEIEIKPESHRQLVAVPFVITNSFGQGHNTFNLDGSENTALIGLLRLEARQRDAVSSMLNVETEEHEKFIA